MNFPNLQNELSWCIDTDCCYFTVLRSGKFTIQAVGVNHQTPPCANKLNSRWRNIERGVVIVTDKFGKPRYFPFNFLKRLSGMQLLYLPLTDKVSAFDGSSDRYMQRAFQEYCDGFL